MWKLWIAFSTVAPAVFASPSPPELNSAPTPTPTPFLEPDSPPNSSHPRRLCNKNADCPSRWCEGGTFYSSGSCTPQRADGEQAAGSWPAFDYNICLSGNGICGKCGVPAKCGSTCTANADCETGWCSKRGSCAGICRPKNADGTRITCSDPLNPTAGGCDYKKCETGAGKCGVCGNTVPEGSTCSAEADCATGICRFGQSGTSALCKGTCVTEKLDGESLPELAVPTIYKGTLSRYDYSECKAKTGQCGVCGGKVPEGAMCTSDNDCDEGLCCAGGKVRTISVDCGGTCKKKSPMACPALMSLDGLQASVEDGVKIAVDAGKCLVGVAESMVSGFLGGADKASCTLDMSKWKSMKIKLSCAILDGEASRRLAAADPNQDGVWARRFGYASPAEAALAPTAKLSFGNFYPQPELGIHHNASGRALAGIGIGSPESPKSYVIACEERASCKAGAQFNYFASVDFKPEAVFEADPANKKVTVNLKGTVTGSAGFAVSGGGGCAESKSWSYPEKPKPVATYCLLAVCITVVIQARMDLDLQGTLAVQASAEYHVKYQLDAQFTLSLDVNNLDQSAGAQFSAVKVGEYWKLSANGAADASATLTLGPQVTVLVVPGGFATVFPHVVGEASLYGEMAYEQESGSKLQSIPDIQWPEEIKCKDAKIRRRRSGTGKKQTSKKKGNGRGKGFEVPVQVGTDNCVAMGFSVSAGVEVTGIGPPENFSPTDMTQAACDEMERVFSKAGPAGMGNEVLGCIAPSLDMSAQCQKIVNLLPLEAFTTLDFINQVIPINGEECTDVLTDFIGCGACQCRVGCQRRGDASAVNACMQSKGGTCMAALEDVPEDPTAAMSECQAWTYRKEQARKARTASKGARMAAPMFLSLLVISFELVQG